MKKLLLTLCLIAFCHPVLASPLVFKTSKPVASPESFVELFTLETAKYSKLRLNIICSSGSLNYVVKAMDGDDELLFFAGSIKQFYDNALFDVPPAKIRVYVMGTGTVRAYVWAQ